jgi:hypothetical protein
VAHAADEPGGRARSPPRDRAAFRRWLLVIGLNVATTAFRDIVIVVIVIIVVARLAPTTVASLKRHDRPILVIMIVVVFVL